jgi:hypothetical protein
MRRIVFLVGLSCMLASGVHAQRTVTDSPHIRIAHPESASPEQDCMRATGRHDLRFVGVAGFALDVPGVPDYQARYWKTNGVKIIARTSDVGDRAFNDAARNYARRYNAQLLKYLSRHKASNAKT